MVGVAPRRPGVAPRRKWKLTLSDVRVELETFVFSVSQNMLLLRDTSHVPITVYCIVKAIFPTF